MVGRALRSASPMLVLDPGVLPIVISQPDGTCRLVRTLYSDASSGSQLILGVTWAVRWHFEASRDSLAVMTSSLRA